MQMRYQRVPVVRGMGLRGMGLRGKEPLGLLGTAKGLMGLTLIQQKGRLILMGLLVSEMELIQQKEKQMLILIQA
jgi:hypothetical protein